MDYVNRDNVGTKEKIYSKIFNLDLGEAPENHLYIPETEKKLSLVYKIDDALNAGVVGLKAAGGLGIAVYGVTSGNPLATFGGQALLYESVIEGVVSKPMRYGTNYSQNSEANKLVKEDNKR
jgi:hypothetical protein